MVRTEAIYDSWREPEHAKGRALQCCVHGRPCPFAQRSGSEISDSEANEEQSKVVAAAAAAEGYEQVAPAQEGSSRLLKQSCKRVKSSSKKNWKNHSLKCSKHKDRTHQTSRRKEKSFIDVKSNSEQGYPFTRHRVERQPILRSSDSECLHASANLYRSSRKGIARGRSRDAQHNHDDYEENTSTPRYEPVSMSKAKETPKSNKRSGGFSSGISPVPLRSCGSGVQTAKHAESETTSLSSVYIGVLTPREAENYVIEPTSFRLYHKLPMIRSLREIPPKLPLTIVYCNDNRMHYHYAIKERKRFVESADSSGQLLPVISFQVDYGDTQAPIFTSVRSLVNYYTVYSQLRHTDDGGNAVDIFPRWHCKNMPADEER